MKKTNVMRITAALLALMTVCMLPSCSAPNMDDEKRNDIPYDLSDVIVADGEAADFVENPFVLTADEPTSTFSADVDTASYTYFRKLVNSGVSAQSLKSFAGAFRTEEFLNYFRYDVKAPAEGELFAVTTALVPAPWNARNVLLRMTLQAEDAVPAAGHNLVFLIDVSGSMAAADKLPLLKKTFSVLVGQLTERDRVSVVTYSGAEEVLLRGCPGNQGDVIMQAINRLTASGSTNGEAGLRTAYSLAADYFIEGGTNRIIMASDGDLNVGISSPEELKKFVEGKRDMGIYLSVLGFGTGNYRDGQMEALADNGNGVYYYIDGETEAEKVFGTDLLATLYTVANDVKMQVTFDPAVVSAYRLIGYENRLLNNEDFEDDTKDAGEVGAGHQVTVFYELVPTSPTDLSGHDDAVRLSVRGKKVGDVSSTLNEYTIGGDVRAADDDTAFMTAVIGAVMCLHDSSFRGSMTLSDVASRLDGMDLTAHPDRAEFRDLLHRIAGGE